MAEVPTIAVSSLRGAMRAVLEVPQGRRNIVVNTVRVDHASAMRELLRVQTAGRQWKVENKRRLKKLSVADELLAIVGHAVLSVLIQRPTDGPMLALLRSYAHRIKRCAGEVGGSFKQPVERLCDDILHHVNQGRRFPRQCTASWLLENAKDLQRQVTRLRTYDFSLPPHDD